MKFDILNTEYTTTIITEVEYTFEDGTKEIIEVPHFEAASIEEIQQNIQNRYDSILLERSLKK